MKLKQAFTLAEVLITLTIIGVVAAITIPSLITSIDLDKRQAEATIKKTYTTFNDATKQIVMLETTSHTMGDVDCSDANCIRDLYGKYVSFVRTCNSDSQENCLGSAPAESEGDSGATSMFALPAYATGNASSIGFSSRSLAVLADGTLVGFLYDESCSTTTKSIIEYEGTPTDIEKTCVSIAVDTNGDKKPNAVGKDRYQFAVGKLGVKFRPPNYEDPAEDPDDPDTP